MPADNVWPDAGDPRFYEYFLFWVLPVNDWPQRIDQGTDVMKIIIIGAGEVGYHIARKLSEENHDIVLLDNDPVKIKRVNDDLDVQGRTGSGTSPRDLKASGIEEAELMVDYVRENQEHLEPWEPLRSTHYYSSEFWEKE